MSETHDWGFFECFCVKKSHVYQAVSRTLVQPCMKSSSFSRNAANLSIVSDRGECLISQPSTNYSSQLGSRCEIFSRVQRDILPFQPLEMHD
jgi:hypothetical protein